MFSRIAAFGLIMALAAPSHGEDSPPKEPELKIRGKTELDRGKIEIYDDPIAKARCYVLYDSGIAEDPISISCVR